MAYQLEPAKPLGVAIAHLACGLLDDGIKEAGANKSQEERVHHARTTCKKVRALLRLLRDRHREFFRRENRRLRAAANRLARFRDAEVLQAAIGLLQPAGRAERAALQALRRRLAAHREAVLADKKGVGEQLAAFRRELDATRAVVKRWRPKDRGFAAIEPEIRKTYRRARRLGRQLNRAAPGTEYHQWRKAVKTFGYHCRLLRGAWPEVARPFAREADRLGHLLGTEHDLTVLGDFVTKSAEADPKPASSGKFILKLIDRQRFELRRRAHAAGDRLFAEKPRAYAVRLQRWWETAAKTPGA